VPIRLGDAERAQIAAAALRQGLPLSGFVRQAALQVSAIVTAKATVKTEREPEPAREVSVLDTDVERVHVVDGLRMFADGRVAEMDESDESDWWGRA
jgi:multidrug efflux pump subunit AcrA (membrane-fusion protein)